jgi:ABC-type multidrug transport system fused ATPase/permease subunit
MGCYKHGSNWYGCSEHAFCWCRRDVVMAGLLVLHNRYMIEYENASISLSIIFWSIVIVTSISVLYIKFSEDRKEKKKQGVYDSLWQDNSMKWMRPFAKVRKAGEELSSNEVSELGNITHVESLVSREQTERSFCAPTQSLVDQSRH